MSDINVAVQSGRLGQDPEFKTVGDTEVAKFSLATSKKWKNKQGEVMEETNWHQVEVWGGLCKVLRRVPKGGRVIINGEIKYESWEKDGEKKYATKIKAHSLTVIDWTDEEGNSAPAPAAQKTASAPAGIQKEEDDLPF
tara:strand:+ start:129 stop:545 length:417 start_codon:yes stop_codon:yes gene_type:complete